MQGAASQRNLCIPSGLGRTLTSMHAWAKSLRLGYPGGLAGARVSCARLLTPFLPLLHPFFQTGPGVKGLHENDWVVPLKPFLGTWRSLLVAAEKDLLRLAPDAMPMEQCAVLRETLTAYRLLEDAPGLKVGGRRWWGWKMAGAGRGGEGACPLAGTLVVRQAGTQLVHEVCTLPQA